MNKFFEAIKKAHPALAEAALADNGAPAAVTAVAAPPPAPAPVPVPVPLPVEAGVAELPLPDYPERTDTFVEGAREVNLAVSTATPVLPFDGTDDKAAEHYRIIRTKIIQHPRSPKVICLTSGGVGDGKSINSINIAGVLALKQNTRVLLVDCDFRRPALARVLGQSRSPGMSEVLAGTVPWQDCLLRFAEAPNLYLIPAGSPTDSPVELLDAPGWKAACEVFRKNFDFVIIDSPPIGKVADYDLIQAACDGIIVVVREGHSNRKLLQEALQIVPREKLTGVVMNCITPWFLRKPSAYSSYYGQKPAQPESPKNSGGR